jgi:hypothetical protein
LVFVFVIRIVVDTGNGLDKGGQRVSGFLDSLQGSGELERMWKALGLSHILTAASEGEGLEAFFPITIVSEFYE